MSDPLATKGLVDREVALRIFNDELEILARTTGDTTLAAYVGTTMTGGQVTEGLPSYGSPVSVVNGTSLRAAIMALDANKNRKMAWQNTAGTTIITDATIVKFGPLFGVTTPSAGTVYVTISGNIVHNLASTLEGIYVAGGEGARFFTQNRFCIGIAASNRLIGAIAAVYSVIGGITLYGRQGAIGS